MPVLERISDAFGHAQPVFSFEFFPPKTDAGFEGLYETIADLKRLDPAFVSVTWGAGGSTRRKTVELVTQIQRELGITAMAHLSCVGSGRAQLAETLDQLGPPASATSCRWAAIRLRTTSPPPRRVRATPASWSSSSARARTRRFSLGGACYPETHPRAPSPESDLGWTWSARSRPASTS